MRSGQLMSFVFRCSDRSETVDVSLAVRVLYLEWGNTNQSYGPRTSAHEPAPLNLSPTNSAFARRKPMSDQVMNERLAEQSQVGVVETSLPFSMPPSDKMLSRITILLFILVVGLLTVFGYYASSICITVILAGFLSILFDPVVVILENCICRAVSPRPALCSQAWV